MKTLLIYGARDHAPIVPHETFDKILTKTIYLTSFLPGKNIWFMSWIWRTKTRRCNKSADIFFLEQNFFLCKCKISGALTQWCRPCPVSSPPCASGAAPHSCTVKSSCHTILIRRRGRACPCRRTRGGSRPRPSSWWARWSSGEARKFNYFWNFPALFSMSSNKLLNSR